MKKFSLKALALFGSIGLLLVSAGTANAQGRARGRNYSRADVDRIIKRVETRSDDFRKRMDKSLDKGRLDGTEAEDRINEQTKEFEESLDKLRKEFDRTDTWLNVRSQVQQVLTEARDVNEIMHNRILRADVESEWALLRRDLNTLAGVYNLALLR